MSLDEANAATAVDAIAGQKGDAEVDGEESERNQRERADAGQYKIHGGVLLESTGRHGRARVGRLTRGNPTICAAAPPSQ